MFRIFMLAFCLMTIFADISTGATNGIAIVAVRTGGADLGLLGPAGHVGVAFEDPNTGKFTCGGVENPNGGWFVKGEGNGGWFKEDLTLEEVIAEFHERDYDGIRIIKVENANPGKARDSIETFPYRGFVGGLNDCLTSTDEVLDEYGAKDMPSVWNLAPITYYEKIKGEEYLWNNLENTYTSPSTGNSLISENIPISAVDALSVVTSPSSVTLEDIPKSNAKDTIQSTSQLTDAKFSIGARVQVTDSLNVRDAPGLSSGTVISTKTAGSTATVLGGPYYADGFTWWKMQYADGTKGYSQEKRLELLPTSTAGKAPVDTKLQYSSQETTQTTSQSTDAKFSIGAKVEVTDSLNVRDAPGLSAGTVISTKTAGSTATVLSGPYYADGFTWWKMQYADGTKGYSQEKRLELVPTNQLSVTKPVDRRTVTHSDDQEPVSSSSDGQVSSSTSDEGQIMAKFTIPPGGKITGTDGAGHAFQATADENGYVAIPGSPGSWKLTASAPGYKTLTLDHQYSGSEVYGGSGYVGLGLQKDEIKDQAPEQALAYFSVKKGGVSGTVLVPGATITVQDGSGKIIQQTVDKDGHVTIAGATGLWQYAITAPGYATQKGYLSVSGRSTSSTSANLQPDESGQSISEPVSFDPVSPQVTEKFQAAPGTLITGTDGAGNEIRATADENGYAVITAAPGNWQWTASAPGYLTSGPSNYLFTADSRMTLPQTKDPNSQPVSASSPSIDQQTVTQPVDPQSTAATDENAQGTTQISPESVQPLDGGLPPEQEPDTQLADPQSDPVVAENIQGIPLINTEPVQLISQGEGLSLEPESVVQPANLQSYPALVENIQGIQQITREPVQLSSMDTTTGLIDPVSTGNSALYGLPYNNSTNGTSQTLADQPIMQPEAYQYPSNTQYGQFSQEQKDDILIDYLESQTQGRELTEEEANNLMNQLDEMQAQLDQQTSEQPIDQEPAFGDG